MEAKTTLRCEVPRMGKVASVVLRPGAEVSLNGLGQLFARRLDVFRPEIMAVRFDGGRLRGVEMTCIPDFGGGLRVALKLPTGQRVAELALI